MTQHHERERLRNIAKDIKRQLNIAGEYLSSPDELLLRDAINQIVVLGMNLVQIESTLNLLIESIDELEVEV